MPLSRTIKIDFIPNKLSAILFWPLLSKASKRHPTVASRPLISLHFSSTADALSLARWWSVSILRSLLSDIWSSAPSSFQQFPASSSIDKHRWKVTTSFLSSFSTANYKDKAYYISDLQCLLLVSSCKRRRIKVQILLWSFIPWCRQQAPALSFEQTTESLSSYHPFTTISPINLVKNSIVCGNCSIQQSWLAKKVSPLLFR